MKPIQKTAAHGVAVRYSKAEAIPHDRKSTLNSFMRMVWCESRTNLHYLDFKAVFGAHLKAMYRPVKLVLVVDFVTPENRDLLAAAKVVFDRLKEAEYVTDEEFFSLRAAIEQAERGQA